MESVSQLSFAYNVEISHVFTIGLKRKSKYFVAINIKERTSIVTVKDGSHLSAPLALIHFG